MVGVAGHLEMDDGQGVPGRLQVMGYLVALVALVVANVPCRQGENPGALQGGGPPLANSDL